MGDVVQEAEEFSSFVRKNSRSLLQTGWWLTGGDWAASEDLVQAALSKTWTHWAAVSGSEHSLAYVRRIMVTTQLSWRARRWNSELATEVIEHPCVDDAFARVERLQVVRSALLKLPPRQRTVVVLRYFLDCTEAATAEAMGCSIGSVKTHHARAMRALRAVPNLNQLDDEAVQ